MRQIWGHGLGRRSQIESDFLRFGHDGADPVRGLRRLLPYTAGSGRPSSHSSPSFACFLFLLRSKPGIVPRVLTGTGNAFPQLDSAFCVSTCLFLLYGHCLRVLENTQSDFVSIGRVIASETEEDIPEIGYVAALHWQFSL